MKAIWDFLTSAGAIRVFRILVAQAITFAIAAWGGVNIPILNITVGAVINGIAKALRDKFGWNWLPI